MMEEHWRRGKENKKFDLNMLSLRCPLFLQVAVTRRQVEIQTGSSEAWSGLEVSTGFINVP